MKLADVRRSTPGDEVLIALGEVGACALAREWVAMMIRVRPNITAQGLWRACKRADWVQWLVEQLAECEQDLEAFRRIEVILPWDTSPTAARNIRRQYESPWLL